MIKLWTIAWLALPFLLGFVIFLLPKVAKPFAFLGAVASAAYALLLFWEANPLRLQLLDRFGVVLLVDSLSGYFILTNALVTAAVVAYCWRGDKSPFFYAQILMVHGSINAAFVCADFVSLYVALEVSGIAAFLLIAYPRSDLALSR
jgi:multicomponent Na+:H+ antiporter subunit D